MPRLTADQWAAIRMEWEGEPLATYTGLGEKFGVDKSEISRRAKRESWVKRGQLASINESAQRKADLLTDAHGCSTQRELNTGDLATRTESEDLRAAVTARHRTEWGELEAFRQAALEAMQDARQNGDRETWSIAKLAADTAKANLSALEIKQQGERRAWGLDMHGEEDIVIANPRGAG
ncbi:MAG: hypothetical protein KAX64_02260 [Chromatiaceae bacterium]|nr:hypothetical protein [Chromatiaceae bacterium]